MGERGGEKGGRSVKSMYRFDSEMLLVLCICADGTMCAVGWADWGVGS